MKKAFVSVIIPTLNEEKTLPGCLQSLKNQNTHYPFEVIVVDYKSKDKTKTIARKYMAKLINERIAGRAAARQHGAEKALGEILAFSEADCRLPSDWIQTMAGHFKKTPRVVGVTGIYSFNRPIMVRDQLTTLVLYFTVYIYRIFMGNHSFRGTNFAVRKSVFRKTSGFNPDYAPGDDVEFGMRIRKMGPIHFLPEMKIITSDRRIKGRLFKFLVEYIRTYLRLYILGKKGHDKSFAIIR